MAEGLLVRRLSLCRSSLGFNHRKMLPFSSQLKIRQRNLALARRSFHLSSSCARPKKSSEQTDKPIAYSLSRARRHTVNDTLGIRQSVSNVPVLLGLGLFTILFYVGFIRSDSEVNWRKMFEMQPEQPDTDKISNVSHEANSQNSQSEEKGSASS